MVPGQLPPCPSTPDPQAPSGGGAVSLWVSSLRALPMAVGGLLHHRGVVYPGRAACLSAPGLSKPPGGHIQRSGAILPGSQVRPLGNLPSSV